MGEGRKMTIAKKHGTPSDFDTLLLSDDRELFEIMTGFLQKNEPERSLKLSQNLSELHPIEFTLRKCDILLCDIRSNVALIEMGGQLVESASMQLMPIGLCDSTPLQKDLLTLPFCFRFADIAKMNADWKNIWGQIVGIKFAWNNPLMLSKIEDVPVSDVLQMISVGRWNSMVQINGRVSKYINNELVGSERMRGNISFWNGAPHVAWSSFHAGIDAIYDLLSVKNGVLQVIRLTKPPYIRNIQREMQDILLSFAVLFDETLEGANLGIEEINQPIQTGPIAEQGKVSAEPPPEFSNLNAEEKQTAYNAPISAFKSRDLLDSWWCQDFDSLRSALANTEPRSLPLRWMNDDDIQRLTISDSQSKFLILRAETEFLISMLGLCARGFETEKLKSSWIPVVRLGRFQKTNLYLVCIETAAPCDSLKKYPCVFYSRMEDLESKIGFIANAGHPAVIFLVPGLDQGLSVPQDLTRSVPVACEAVAAPLLRWDALAQTLSKVLSLLSKIASGGTT
jgi:hypothetical protein